MDGKVTINGKRFYMTQAELRAYADANEHATPDETTEPGYPPTHGERPSGGFW